MAARCSCVMSVAGSDLVEWSDGLCCWREELSAEISWDMALTVVVAPEAHELAGCRHRTGVKGSRRHGHHGPQAGRHAALASEARSKADQLPARSHRAGVVHSRGHGHHWPEAEVHPALALVVTTPAGEDALRADGAAVKKSCCEVNRGAEPRRHLALVIFVARRPRPSPSVHRCGRGPLQPPPRDLNLLGRRTGPRYPARSRPALHWPSRRSTRGHGHHGAELFGHLKLELTCANQFSVRPQGAEVAPSSMHAEERACWQKSALPKTQSSPSSRIATVAHSVAATEQGA